MAKHFRLNWAFWFFVAAGLPVTGAPGATPALPEGEIPSSASELERIERLTEQLGHEDYFVRQRAQEELARYSFEAFDALTAATQHEDLEVAARARYLLRLLTVAWTTKDDPEEVRKLLSDYEVQDGPQKLARMRALAALEGGRGTPALCRLVRFEQSPVLSKHAALALLEREGPGEPPGEELCRQLETHLAGSQRPAAKWLLAWPAFRRDPAAAVAEWAKSVEQEEDLLHRRPSHTSTDIVAGLAHFQVAWHRQLGQTEAALAAARVLIRLEKGDPDELIELLDWLIEQQAWAVVDEMAARFDDVFAENPVLLYTLADALLAQDKKSAAQRAADRALGVHPGGDVNDLRRHAITAQTLEERGQMRWAYQEFRHVIHSGTPGSGLTVTVRRHLSELLHDQGEHLKAGETLEELLAAMEKPPADEPGGDEPPRGADPFGARDDERIELDDETLAGFRARMNYFFACHYEERGDKPRQRVYLDKALATGEADIDVLIACYKLPDAGPEYREKVLGLIRAEAARLEENVADEPLISRWYNQYAWLVGNTEGDQDKALKYSKRSIELNPEYGGYYDTLAHVHFARGEYEKAVEVQTKAAELEPHSGLIARKLEVFKKKLAETRKEGEGERGREGEGE